MSKIILVVPQETVDCVFLSTAPEAVLVETGESPAVVRNVFRKLATVSDRAACILFVAPCATATAVTRVLDPVRAEFVADGNSVNLPLCGFDTWRGVAEAALWALDQNHSVQKTLVLIPVPEDTSDAAYQALAKKIRQASVTPQVVYRPWGLSVEGLCEALVPGREISRYDGVLDMDHNASFPPENVAAEALRIRKQVAAHLSKTDMWTLLSDTVALVLPSDLACAIARSLLPADQHPDSWEGTEFMALRLPFTNWGELPKTREVAEIQHHEQASGKPADPERTLIPASPTPSAPVPGTSPVSNDVPRQIFFMTPAAWEGDAKAPEKRGSFNTNRPKGELTAEGVRALTEVFQRLEDLDIHPGLVLASTAADATLTAERVRKAWLTSSGKPDLERLALLLSGHKSLSSTFDVLTRPQNAGVATVFVVAASPDLGRLTELMGSAQTFAPHTDVRVAQLQPGVTWADVSRFMKKPQGSSPLAACRALT